MATTEITMPQLGESITEGTVARWLKEAGESIQKYEPLLEITTDKIDTEVQDNLSLKPLFLLYQSHQGQHHQP